MSDTNRDHAASDDRRQVLVEAEAWKLAQLAAVIEGRPNASDVPTSIDTAARILAGARQRAATDFDAAS